MPPEPPIEDPRLRHFFELTLGIAADLSLPTVLQRIVTAACEISGARYGALGILNDEGVIEEFVLEGADPEWIERVGHPPEGKGLIGHLVDHPETLRVNEISEHPSSIGFPPGHPPMHTFLGVPIHIGDTTFGNLYLTEKADGEPFSADDETLVLSLAAAASVAIQNARLHEEAEDLAVVRERDRIARDLHDRVIQRLFATAMSLEAASRTAPDPAASETLGRAVDELDETIREIRSTIFELGQSDDRTLSTEIQALADDLEQVLGFPPVVLLDGDIDALPTDLQGQLLAVIRELLTNVAKHANATTAHVTLRVNDSVSLRVSDNGVGLGAAAASEGSRGTQNLRDRAQRLGGDMQRTENPGGGVSVAWTIPRPA